MAVEILPGSVPVPTHPVSESFADHAAAALNSPYFYPKVDAVSQGLMCCQHARDAIWKARAAREVGHEDLALAWLKSAEFFRLAAGVWYQRTRAGSRAAS